MLKKLRTKFICFTMALVFLLLTVIFGMVYGFTARNLYQDNMQLMYAVSTPIDLPGGKLPMIPAPYLVLQQNSFGLWSVQGSDYFDLTDQTFLSSLLQEVSAQEDREGILKDYDLRYLKLDKPTVRYIFLDVSAERATLNGLIRTCVIIGLLSLVLFFGLALFLARWAVRPVEAAWNHQKQFIADASHELKTPLAVILTNAELLSDSSYPQEEHQQFGQNILTMSYQMRHLVESLLELARLDNMTPCHNPLDLSKLADSVLLPFEPVLFESELVLESEITPGLWVKGNESQLRQLMEIFLDNARKYADPGTVRVTLDKAGNHALLQVENTGAPLTPDEAKQIFRRFYRVDSSRKRDGSYGLGLSIAHTITQQHGGKIWAEGTETGNRFGVLLPLSHRELPE